MLTPIQCRDHYRELRDGAALAGRVIAAILRDETDDLVAADAFGLVIRTFQKQFGRVIMTDGFTHGQRCGLNAAQRKLETESACLWEARFAGELRGEVKEV